MAEPARATDGEALRLLWRQTWPEKDADYCAQAEGHSEPVGRIYTDRNGPLQGIWFWSMTASGAEISRNVGELTGTATSPREAARLVEDAWFAAIKGSSLERLAPKVNTYAAAKAR